MCSKKNVDKVDGIENKNLLASNFNTFRKNRNKVETSFVSKAHISWMNCLFGVKSYFLIYRGEKV